ncbi:MAG: hypothetical protein IPH52_18075 [Leptospiraceae bacterium]|nr:hypothetical protein [Leptospiraceae bacterium]
MKINKEVNEITTALGLNGMRENLDKLFKKQNLKKVPSLHFWAIAFGVGSKDRTKKRLRRNLQQLTFRLRKQFETFEFNRIKGIS